MMQWLNSNLALDLTLLSIGLFGLVLAFGWGNWRFAIQRYFLKSRLESLEAEARQISKDIADTISQERQRKDSEDAREWDARMSGIEVLRAGHAQDQRYLNKHMTEAASIIRRLGDVGYWKPSNHYHEIGTSGATTFAAEASCKELYTAADKIRDDLKHGVIVILSQPESQKGTSENKKH